MLARQNEELYQERLLLSHGGVKLRVIRRHYGWKLEYMAYALGIAVTTLKDYEQIRKEPHGRVYRKMAENKELRIFLSYMLNPCIAKDFYSLDFPLDSVIPGAKRLKPV